MEWLFERDVDDMRWIRLSPDNRWLSAASNRNGRWDVYLMPFPAGDQRWEVSTDGGFEPIWSVDGKALYYRANNNTITRAEITVKDGVPQVGKIEPLFDVLTGVDFYATTDTVVKLSHIPTSHAQRNIPHTQHIQARSILRFDPATIWRDPANLSKSTSREGFVGVSVFLRSPSNKNNLI